MEICSKPRPKIHLRANDSVSDASTAKAFLRSFVGTFVSLFVRPFIIVVALVISMAASADEPKSSSEALEKDFAIACEMSKFSIALGKTAAFKNDEADLAYRVAEMMSGAFKTHEVKDAYKAIASADPKSRVELWHASAKDLGVKNFKCKTIGFK